MALYLFYQDALLPLVDPIYGPEQRHLKERLAHADQRADILGKAGAAVTYSGKDKMGADATIQADSAPNFIHISPDFLAKIRNFVDEGDFRGQQAVGGVLAHLRAARIHNEDRVSRANKRLVELLNELDRLGIVAAQDHPVRLHEILDCSALF